MKISIITVVYNNERTLQHAIDSVVAQTYENVEYILIDGNSTDGTLDIIKMYEDKIDIIVSEKDKGIYDAMNKGVNVATGDVIGILNSDDLYADNKVLEDVMSHFLQKPELDILYGNLVYVKNDDISSVVRNWKSSPYHQRFFEYGNVPPHPALFLRSRVYEKIGVFNLKYKLGADYEFMLRVFKKYDFNSFYLDRLMVKMRLGGATNKSLKNILNGNKEIISAWKDNGFKVPITLMPFKIIKRLLQFL